MPWGCVCTEQAQHTRALHMRVHTHRRRASTHHAHMYSLHTHARGAHAAHHAGAYTHAGGCTHTRSHPPAAWHCSRGTSRPLWLTRVSPPQGRACVGAPRDRGSGWEPVGWCGSGGSGWQRMDRSANLWIRVGADAPGRWVLAAGNATSPWEPHVPWGPHMPLGAPHPPGRNKAAQEEPEAWAVDQHTLFHSHNSQDNR